MDSGESGRKGASVIVVGAGPVGLTAALALVRRGVPVTLLEKRPTLNVASRASTFHPPTLAILEALGVVGPMLAKGWKADRIQYRRVGEAESGDGPVTGAGDAFADFDLALLAGETKHPYRIHLEQAAVTPLLLAQLEASPLARIRFGAEVVDAGSDEPAGSEPGDGGGAWVAIRESAGSSAVVVGTCVLAADGAKSAVREAVGIAHEGESYPGRVLRLMTTRALDALLPGVAPVSYLFRADGSSISLLRMPDCWRVIVRVPEAESDAAVQDPAWYLPRVRRFLPLGEAATPDGGLPLIGKDVYGASKMVADRYREGRVFLIGDSAHLTNTRGGMNMNCGIHDAWAMAEALAGALPTGDWAAVETVADARRAVAVETLIPRTDRNVAGGEAWLAEIAATAADPARARAYLRGTAMLDIAPRVEERVSG